MLGRAATPRTTRPVSLVVTQSRREKCSSESSSNPAGRTGGGVWIVFYDVIERTKPLTVHNDKNSSLAPQPQPENSAQTVNRGCGVRHPPVQLTLYPCFALPSPVALVGTSPTSLVVPMLIFLIDDPPKQHPSKKAKAVPEAVEDPREDAGGLLGIKGADWGLCLGCREYILCGCGAQFCTFRARAVCGQ